MNSDAEEIERGDLMEEPKIKPQLKLVALNYVGKCCGNAEKSVREAGYSVAYARGNAYKILAREDVQAYIQYLRENTDNVRDIMELNDLQEFWSDVIRSEGVKMRDRLRASELLGKSKGAFTDDW